MSTVTMFLPGLVDRFCFFVSLRTGTIYLGVCLVLFGWTGMGLFGWAFENNKELTVVNYWIGCGEQNQSEKGENKIDNNQMDIALAITIILFLFSINHVVNGFLLLFGSILENPALLLPFLITTPLYLISEIAMRTIFLLETSRAMELWGLLILFCILILYPYSWLCIFCFWNKMKTVVRVDDYTISSNSLQIGI